MLSVGEKKLLKLLGEYAKELMSRRGCNDLTEEELESLTDEEWEALHLEMRLENGDPEEYCEGKFRALPNWWVFSHLFRKALK